MRHEPNNLLPRLALVQEMVEKRGVAPRPPGKGLFSAYFGAPPITDTTTTTTTTTTTIVAFIIAAGITITTITVRI